ncbi:MAG: FG-GAP-like repeat-containing protein [Planctomycetes bacterium]|nr:FG-GAP-like repeat-containing protein [Planctomycetota bacterium]
MNIRSLTTLFFLTTIATAFAADPQGPAFGGNRFAAAITSTEMRPDSDDYVSRMIEGERITVTVKAAKGSPLVPGLSLIAPDGAVIDEALLGAKLTAGGIMMKRFEIPRTGRWTVRVTGKKGTSGAYTIAFQTAAAPTIVRKNMSLSDVGESAIPFEAVNGSTLDLQVTWKSSKAPVSLASISDPRLHAVPGAVAAVRKNSLRLQGLALNGGDGTYKLRLAHPAGVSVVNVTIKVTPKGRPAGAKPVVLSDAEPWLQSLEEPMHGVAGMSTRLTGGNFSEAAPPTVLFDRTPATVTVVAGGTALDVIPPELAIGTTAAISVIAADGQAAVAEDYFYYVPEPWFGDVVNASGTVLRAFPRAGGNTVDIRGSNFDPGIAVRFGSTPATSVIRVNPTRLRVVVPPSLVPVHIFLEDTFGRTTESSVAYDYIAAPTITHVAASGEATIDATHIAVGGGAQIAIDGTNLDAGDVATLGGRTCTFVASTPTGIVVTAPFGSAGPANLLVKDEAAQTASVLSALTFVGWADPVIDRSPTIGPVDDFRAVRGVLADVDNDGSADDMVIVSDGASGGTRSGLTRILLGQNGRMVDVTGTNMPQAFSDSAGADSWQAHAVVVRDIDGDKVADLLLGDVPVPDTDGDFEARILLNDTAGVFGISGISPHVRTSSWDVFDTDDGLTYPLLSPGTTNGGRVTALAVGDIDGDGEQDVVIATDHFRTATLHYPLDQVTFSGDDATATGLAMGWDPNGRRVDTPALRVFLNKTGSTGAFEDATFTRLPKCSDTPSTSIAYHARDMKLVDVNGDGALDILVTWDDPTRVTPYGLAYAGSDQARTATRVLINDTKGFFTDQTSSWLPSAGGAEHWQADRLAVGDINGDGRPDLVLIANAPLDTHLGTRDYKVSSLRILRNDGKGKGFADVTSAAFASLPRAGTADDNLRGAALNVVDFDGDGALDILIGTTESLVTSAGAAAPATRVLRGHGDFTFSDATVFMAAAAVDSGETTDLIVGSIAGDGTKTMVPLSMTKPTTSKSGALIRFFDWSK